MIVFSCTARGIPIPIITWSIGTSNGVIQLSDETIDNQGFALISSNLSIPAIQRNDKSYICTASNHLGSQQQSFNLTVNCKYKNSSMDAFTIHFKSPINFLISVFSFSLSL